MPSRAEEQRDRYLRTPCPAKSSRKKLRSVMWQNRKNVTSRALLADTGRKRGKNRFFRGPMTNTNNLQVFKDALASFGGFFEEFTHTGERKKHTSGRRESRPRYVEKES